MELVKHVAELSLTFSILLPAVSRDSSVKFNSPLTLELRKWVQMISKFFGNIGKRYMHGYLRDYRVTSASLASKLKYKSTGMLVNVSFEFVRKKLYEMTMINANKRRDGYPIELTIFERTFSGFQACASQGQIFYDNKYITGVGRD